MKKVYRFNLIPGVEFVENDGFYFTMANNPIWPKSHITKVVIKGLIEYESANNELKTKLKNSEFAISVLNDQIDEYKKKFENAERNCLFLNDRVNYITKRANDEIDHRNKLLDERDEEIKRLFRKLREEAEAHKEYIKTFTDKINALEATLKKKDETIEKLRNTAEFANNICDGYGAHTDSLMNTINENNSEIKVLSDQVTRLMDQLKEVTGENPGCKSCSNGSEPCCDKGKSETNLGKFMYDMFLSALDTWLKGNSVCGGIKPCRLTPEMVAEFEREPEKEAKPETNFDRVMTDMHSKLTPARLAEMISKYDCKGVRCNECPFNTIAEPYGLKVCNMSIEMLDMLVEWLSENAKED